MFLNLEAQNDFYPGYPLVKRGIYYGSRMISAQYGTVFSDSHYEKIQKVYSIWICTNPPKYRRNTILRYSIQEEPLVGKVKEDKAAYDLLTVVMICLGTPEDANYSGLLKMLEVLLSKERTPSEKKRILQEEFDIVLTKEMKEEVKEMCNLSQGVYNDGWNKGWDSGWNDGKNEGKEEAILSALGNLKKSTGWSIEKCMEILEVPQEQKEIYMAKLEVPVSV